MGENTRPFFIVGSGRSGTQMMEKLLGGFPNVEIHHEYLCTHVQPLAVRYYMGLATLPEVVESLRSLHGAAIHCSPSELWGDSSNKLSWLIEGLNLLFPTAKFIHVVRDGRKVVSSFYHKLSDECYDDYSTSRLQAFIDDPDRNPAPPPEKRYWWNLPRPGTPEAETFRKYNQFQRICFHWREANRFVMEKLADITPQRTRTYKLETLTKDPAVLRDMLEFLQLPYSDKLFAALQRPHNVNIPQDFPLSEEQREHLMAIAGDMMHRFGYDMTREYRMVYDANHPTLQQEMRP